MNRGGTAELNLVSLFAGIGGFELGLERAGFKTVAQCEISEVCRHLLATHWPDVQRFGDICEMRAADVPHRVHAMCGGFPCQDISFAGKGEGIAGARSGLWSEYARLIGEFRPDVVFVENVSALLGRGLGVVLGDLAALGYDAWWDCIPAAAVGAPHRRDRLWLIAYPRGVEHEGFGDALRRAVAAELSRAVAEQGFPVGHDPEADALDPDAHGFGSYRAGIDVLGDAELRDEQVGLFEPLGGDVAHAYGEPAQSVGGPGDVGSAPAEDQGAGEERERLRDAVDHGCEDVADADSQRQEGRGLSALAGQAIPYAFGSGPADGWTRSRSGGWWTAEPNVGRVAHGVPARVDKLHGLGNAVVPRIPEALGLAYLTAKAWSAQQRLAA